MAFSFWLEPFKVNVTWGKKKRKDVITRCQSNNTFLIALLINICWCLELTNTLIHPYWASPVKLNNCLAFGSVKMTQLGSLCHFAEVDCQMLG